MHYDTCGFAERTDAFVQQVKDYYTDALCVRLSEDVLRKVFSRFDAENGFFGTCCWLLPVFPEAIKLYNELVNLNIPIEYGNDVILLNDTRLSRMSDDFQRFVLYHELGHFKLEHNRNSDCSKEASICMENEANVYATRRIGNDKNIAINALMQKISYHETNNSLTKEYAQRVLAEVDYIKNYDLVVN